MSRIITVVTGGPGNVGSVRNMLRRLDCEVLITSEPGQVVRADKLILPGVGSFDAGMQALRERKLDAALHEAVSNNGARLLGICLGMQLLMEGSEEGSAAGLGLVRGRVRRLVPGERRLRVPHMGWNVVRPLRASTLFAAEPGEQRFYFVHSYYVECAEPGDVAGMTDYGIEFASVIERGQVCGVQFHAEKSHRFGMALLARFIES
jgi:glutamine amidotransferase